MMHSQPHHQQHSTPPQSHHINPPSCSSISLRSPSATSTAPIPPHSHGGRPPEHLPFGVSAQALESSGPLLARVRLSDISPYDGAPSQSYFRAVEALSSSLMRHNAAVIEVSSDDAAVLRCGLDSARFYLRTPAATGGAGGGGGGGWSKGNRGMYIYKPSR